MANIYTDSIEKITKEIPNMSAEDIEVIKKIKDIMKEYNLTPEQLAKLLAEEIDK